MKSKPPDETWLVISGDGWVQTWTGFAKVNGGVKYIREDLSITTTKKAIEDAASEVFNYVHETDGGHKADFTQLRVIEILTKHFKELQ